MDRTERFHLIDQMLSCHQVVSRQKFLDTLEISPATFKRDLEYLRDRLGAPIIWHRELRGYQYQQQKDLNRGKPFQLPGLWFNASEIQALLTMNAWLENLQPGMLANHIEPLKSRIRGLLDQSEHDVEEITRRIRILTQPRKSTSSESEATDFFALISQALLKRKQLFLVHFNRSTGQMSEREVSPQRLTFYRDNWYLDSWCHHRKAIRSFAVDALNAVEILPLKAINITNSKLDGELASGYGIFSGVKTRNATLRFTPERARWVAHEQWHPDQQSYFDDEGFYLLTVPYSQETELLMDILKHGADVTVIKPKSLRDKVLKSVESTRLNYLP